MADAPATLEERLNASVDKLAETQASDKPAKAEEKVAVKSEAETDDEDNKPAEGEKKAEPKSESKSDEDGDEEEEEEPAAKSGAEKKGEDADEEDEDEDEEITPEFKAALSKQRFDFAALEGLNKKERQAVLQHVTLFNRSYTKAQMEATTFRKEKASFETERSYRDAHPDRYIADILAKTPELLDKVNAELKKRENPDYLEALEIRRAAEQKSAEADATVSETKAEELQERVATLEASTARAAKEAGLPDEFAQEAVANAILQKRTRGEEANLTDAEISDIISDRAAIFKKHVGAHKAASTREANNKYVKDKAEDARNTKSVRPKAGSIERKQVSGEKPKDLGDFIDRWTTANVG